MMNSHQKQYPDHHHQTSQGGDMMNNFSYSSGTTVTTELIQRYLDENRKLILAILDSQSLGKLHESATYQAKLQNNLFYLAAIADAQPQPPFPTPNLQVRTSAMLQSGQPQYVQPQHHQLQQQMVNQSILGKGNTYLSYLHPMHGIPQQQQQVFLHASSSGVNANPLFDLPGYEMGGALNSSGTIHDFSNGLTSSTTVQGNMDLNANRPDPGDTNTRERASGSGQGAQNSDTYLSVPEDGK